MIENGKKVRLNYTIKIDGKNAAGGVQEVEYIHGARKIIPILEEGLIGLNVGDKKTIKISSEDGHIPYDPKRVKEVERSIFKNEKDIEVGKRVELKDDKSGQLFAATITEIKEDKVVVDYNHPLAGKNVEFNVEVLSIEG